METAVTRATERLDHLGIVAGLCREIGLAEFLGEQAKGSRQRVTIGTDVAAGALIERMRTTQIKCGERLASRFPPRLRRCLTTFPEDASTGETPAQTGEGGLAIQPLGIVSHGQQERRGVIRTDCWKGDQLWDHLGNEAIKLGI